MLFITGDTHGLNDTLKFNDVYFPEKKNLSKEDFVLITGDFGGLWDGGERDAQTLDFFSEQPFTTLFVDGNHENFDLLNAYPVEEWNGGKIHRIRKDIIHLMRGQIFNIEGNSYFTFGGGLSIDKHLRTNHLTWWKEEFASDEEKEEALENLKRHDNKVDYIVTHTCPKIIKDTELTRCISIIGAKCDTENYLNIIFNNISYKTWFCGHYHIDLYFQNGRINFLYQDIINPVDFQS